MAKIENERQYRLAMQRIEELLKRVDNSTPQENKDSVELYLLSELVEEYEEEHYKIEAPSLIDILKLRMFELGLSQCALAKKLGMNQSKISEILSGKREPTLKQARKMAIELNISPAIVLGI